MKTKNMYDSLKEAADNEQIRIDVAAGRADASSYESYGKLKEGFERVEKEYKPLGKLQGELWEAVATKDDTAELAYLHEIRRCALGIASELVHLAALARRAELSLTSTSYIFVPDGRLGAADG